MKRSQLGRRTPLKANPDKPLTAKTQIRQKAPAKPGAVNVERLAKRLVRARSNNVCELRIESVCDGQGLDFSHRLARSQGGPWLASNGVRACRSCHSWCHAHPEVAYSWGWQLRPIYHLVDGKRVLRPAVDFPAYLWTPGAYMAGWVWLLDDGTFSDVNPDNLPLTAGHPIAREGDAAA